MLLNVHANKNSTIVLKRQAAKTPIVLSGSTMILGMKNIMPTPTRTALAKNVRRLRKTAKLSQTELANRAGIAQTAVSYIERASDKSPSLETIEKLAAALGTTHLGLCAALDEPSQQDIQGAGKLLETYISATPEGRSSLLKVAEVVAQYHPR